MARRGKTDGPARLLADRPTLWPGMVHYYEAYQRLSTCRTYHMGGPAAIPWTAIDHYAVRYRYFGPEYDALLHFVEVLDGVYLQFQSSGGKPNAKKRSGELTSGV